MEVLGVLVEKYEDENVPELTQLPRLDEIEIHAAPVSRAQALIVRNVQAATTRMGRQENARRVATRNRAGAADTRMGACVSALTDHRSGCTRHGFAVANHESLVTDNRSLITSLLFPFLT
jgi:hypothetical protein